ncbi:hypothetical protein BH18ACT1_BH18ACT1_02260 [soil metagenome]
MMQTIRITWFRAVAVVALGLALGACLPPNPGPTGLYLGTQADIHPTVTPKASPVTWGSAPPIDEHYGGTLYEGTPIETQDPRPPLLRQGDEPLRLWVADPDNGVKSRPAVIWLHGGGFAVGIDSMYALANSTGREYAQRGYVSFSVEYRTDTTLVGAATAGGRPASLCQWVQDNEDAGDATWEARREQCKRNIIAAQQDVQGAVRWIRKHARKYDVDPSKIAVGGFSAGAVTSANLAYRSEDVGTNRYFPGDRLSVSKSRVRAAIGASGCLYSEDGGPLTRIGDGDAPLSFIHSRYDGAVPYECIAETVGVARSKGLVAELTSYCTERGHAAGLYATHQAATDEQWTTFLAGELDLYSGMRPPSASPVCTN